MLIIFVERLAAVGDSISLLTLADAGWRPLFSKKMAAAASFSFKIGCGSQYLVTLLAVVLTWSGYWLTTVGKIRIFISFPHRLNASLASLLKTLW